MAEALPQDVPLDRISIYKNDLTFVERKVSVQNLSNEYVLRVPNASADIVLNTFNATVEGAEVR